MSFSPNHHYHTGKNYCFFISSDTDFQDNQIILQCFQWRLFIKFQQ